MPRERTGSAFAMGSWKSALGMGLCALVLWAVQPPASGLQLFSTGMQTPETISPGQGAYSAGYYVPDPGRSPGDLTQANIWAVPAGGGAPTAFGGSLSAHPVGGLFLPDGPYWGANAGKLLVVGYIKEPSGNYLGRIHIYEPDGTPSLLWGAPGHVPKTPVIAPDGFGPFGGQVLVADGGPAVYAIDPAGNKTEVVTAPATPYSERFGLAFAPTGWGDQAGNLLSNRAGTNEIFAVDPYGIEELFTTVPLALGQTGLRQMAFGPAGFIPGQGELLFVSVAGSAYGGGTLGDVVGINSNGTVVVSLRAAVAGLGKFDPRGMYFAPGGTLLISDAADPIWTATGADFNLVPEPCTIVLLAGGVMSLLARRRRGR